MNQLQTNSSNKAVFLDANILLEIVLGRSNQTAARNFLKTQSEEMVISSLTAHLVVHFGQKIVDLAVLRTFLSDYTILSLDASDFEWAFTNTRNNDFEDALQLAVAIRNGCSDFVTFDKPLHAAYSSLPLIQMRLLHV